MSWQKRLFELKVMITLYVCVHTVDKYDLEISELTLKFLMGCFYMVLNTTFNITSEVTTVTFKEGRSIHKLSFRS